jgi:hypothetical protein
MSKKYILWGFKSNRKPWEPKIRVFFFQFWFQTNVLNLPVRLKKHSVPEFFFICFNVLFITVKFQLKIGICSKTLEIRNNKVKIRFFIQKFNFAWVAFTPVYLKNIKTKIFLNFQMHKYFKIYFLKVMEELFQLTVF